MRYFNFKSFKSLDVVRRSARLADRFRSGVAAVREARGVSVVESRVCSFARSVTASASSRAPHRSVCARTCDTTRDGAQSPSYGLPAVRINLVRCSVTAIRTASVTLERCLVTAIRPASFTIERNIGTAEVVKVQTHAIRSALRIANVTNRTQKTVRFADPTPHSEWPGATKIRQARFFGYLR